MRPIYYRDKELKACPVKVFLSKYAYNKSDPIKIRDQKLKILAEIDNAILCAADNNGIIGGLYTKPLTGYGISEIRIKHSDDLIRIYYFCFMKDKLVLLNACEKPDGYEKGKKKKIDKFIKEQQQLANKYKLIFLNNPKSYEEYK